MATYNISLVGGRAEVTVSDGQIVGLNANTAVGLYLDGTVYMQTYERNIKALYTDITVSSVAPTSGLDAVTKINTLIGTATNEVGGSSGGGGGGSTTPVTPVTKTTGLISVTNSGSIATGSSYASIINIGNANGTLKGVTLPIGVGVTWESSYGELNDAIAYDATGTTFLIATRR